MNSIQNRIPAVDLTPAGHLPYTVHAADERIACQAAAVFVANAAYKAALESNAPAKSLDNMCDALPEVMPQVIAVVKTGGEYAEVLKTAITDRLWAFTGIEHARAEAGAGYGYVFDLLADDLKAGRDPHLARKTALDVPKRLREIAEQARETPAPSASPNPVGVMLGTTQCCARRPDRDQLNGRRLDGREDTGETFNDRLLCVEQHDHNGDHRDALGRTWLRVPAGVTR